MERWFIQDPSAKQGHPEVVTEGDEGIKLLAFHRFSSRDYLGDSDDTSTSDEEVKYFRRSNHLLLSAVGGSCRGGSD